MRKQCTVAYAKGARWLKVTEALSAARVLALALLTLSATTSIAADITPPTAPTGLTATAVGLSQINLSWTASTDNVGVPGYLVERCQGAGCTKFAQIVAVAGTSFSNTGVTAGTSYSYRVRANDAAGNLSGYSNVVSAMTDATAPTAPVGLTATASSASQIDVRWTASTDNVGVTGYQVERCQGAGCTTFAQIVAPTGTSFSNTGLTAATSYSYRVRARDAAGNLSGYSNVASATTGVVNAYYIHPDHLNTPRLIANQAGTTVWRWDQQEPFGSTPPNDNPSGLGAFTFNLRFPGQYFDRETNLAYNYFRDYDPGTGRYVRSDPIGIRGGLNTYLYASGSPVSLVDPRGLDSGLVIPSTISIGEILIKIARNACTAAESVRKGLNIIEQMSEQAYRSEVEAIERTRQDAEEGCRRISSSNPCFDFADCLGAANRWSIDAMAARNAVHDQYRRQQYEDTPRLERWLNVAASLCAPDTVYDRMRQAY
jgi:RHS repeat-associated protein